MRAKEVSCLMWRLVRGRHVAGGVTRGQVIIYTELSATDGE